MDLATGHILIVFLSASNCYSDTRRSAGVGAGSRADSYQFPAGLQSLFEIGLNRLWLQGPFLMMSYQRPIAILTFRNRQESALAPGPSRIDFLSASNRLFLHFEIGWNRLWLQGRFSLISCLLPVAISAFRDRQESALAPGPILIDILSASENRLWLQGRFLAIHCRLPVAILTFRD